MTTDIHKGTSFIGKAPTLRADGMPHPTPIEIRMAIAEALTADAYDMQTPAVPPHVMGLIRRAISKACEGHTNDVI
jgi:hypothetical protein